MHNSLSRNIPLTLLVKRCSYFTHQFGIGTQTRTDNNEQPFLPRIWIIKDRCTQNHSGESKLFYIGWARKNGNRIYSECIERKWLLHLVFLSWLRGENTPLIINSLPVWSSRMDCSVRRINHSPVRVILGAHGVVTVSQWRSWPTNLDIFDIGSSAGQAGRPGLRQVSHKRVLGAALDYLFLH